MSKETIILIDGSSLIYRAFHAVPPSFVNSKGMPTNAVYGFTQSVLKIIADFKPAYIVVAYDSKGPSFRHELFTEYKADRPPMPDALSVQIPYIKQMVAALNIKSLELTGFEADDVMATIVKRTSRGGLKAALVTGDKDMYQLVNEDTTILDYVKNIEIGPAETIVKFGVAPGQIRDLLSLAGDSSDNIPGVKGIGRKTAVKLLTDFGSIDGIYENIGMVKSEKTRQNLIEHKESAMMSRELATLHPDVPLDFSLDDCRFKGFDLEVLAPLLTELGFRKLLNELAPGGGSSTTASPGAGVATPDVQVITEADGLSKAMGSLMQAREVSIAAAFDDTGFGAKLRCVGLNFSEKTICVLIVESSGLEFKETLKEAALAAQLKPLLEDKGVIINTDDSKALYLWTARFGIKPAFIRVDTSLASYVVDPSRSSHDIETLTDLYLGEGTSGKGNKNKGDSEEALVGLVARNAFNIKRLSDILYKRLDDDGLAGLYNEMELPLSYILAKMETIGIKIDRDKLGELSREIEIELADTEGRIYAAAGQEFNISSPKQLSEVLFDRLKLKPIKKTKTGFSTDEDVLRKLAPMHDVPSLILAYRSLAKLKSTYVDALLALADPATDRVHTSFNQTVTSTGRLSSSRPNLQNIPVKGEKARRVREAFIAEKGCSLLSADYSQIELRIVAHLSGDPVLIAAFENNEDVHTATASNVFGIIPALVTPEMRRRAKAINFGIIYGMGAYGLSAELGIPARDADEYIAAYFSRFALVKQFMDKTIAEATELGYTTTLFGRRRYIPELQSTIDSVKKFAQRAAINTPVQGAAADMIKAAMITIDAKLRETGLKSKMLLQIHDELLFEVKEGELQEMSSFVSSCMEGVIKLSVPITINLKHGANWRDVEHYAV